MNHLKFQNIPNLIPYRKGDKWGYCDKEKNIIIDCMYNDARPFSEGLAVVNVFGKEGFIGCINESGELIVVLPSFIYVLEDLKDGILKVSFPNEYYGSDEGYIDIFTERKHKKYKNIIPRDGYIYSARLGIPDSEGLELVIKSDPQLRPNEIKMIYGYAKSGRILIKHKYEKALPFSEGLAAVKLNGNWMYINSQDEKILDMLIFDELTSFSEDLGGIMFENKWGFCDKKGNIVIDFQFDEIKEFSEGLCAVSVNQKWGFIDKNGEIVLPTEFERVHSFSEGLAPAWLDEGYGYIDHFGDFVIPQKYIFASTFKNGLALVNPLANTKRPLFQYYIDKLGNEYFEE